MQCFLAPDSQRDGDEGITSPHTTLLQQPVYGSVCNLHYSNSTRVSYQDINIDACTVLCVALPRDNVGSRQR